LNFAGPFSGLLFIVGALGKRISSQQSIKRIYPKNNQGKWNLQRNELLLNHSGRAIAYEKNFNKFTFSSV
jgi:hypothetical protein